MKNGNNINLISTKKTDELDDFPTPDPYGALPERDWFQADIPPYQDEIDINPDALDPVMVEENDDASELFGVSPLAFGQELGRTAIDEGWDNERDEDTDDDYREMIEDRDQGDYDRAA